MALTENYGRAYKVIDTETGMILAESEEAIGAAEASKKYRRY